MGQGGGGHFKETFYEKMYGRLKVNMWMYIPSVLFSFLEAALKRQLRATEVEVK